jgi:hypothetical protein
MDTGILYKSPNSKIIDIEGTPKIPDIGYYNKSLSNDANNSYSKLKQNLNTSCNINFSQESNTNGIYSDTIIQEYLNVDNFVNPFPDNFKNPFSNKNYDELDFPYYLYKIDFKNQVNSSGKKGDTYSIEKIIKNKYTDEKNNITNDGLNRISNQIQYLTCQLVNSRNRYYDSDNFIIFGKSPSVKAVFEKFGKNLFIPLFIVFLMTIYFLISGIFSSLDVGANIINCVQKSNNTKISYWLGIFIGICIPLIILIYSIKNKISNNLKEIENRNITKDPIGIEYKIPSEKKEFDYLTLTLFLLIIFGLSSLVFTIKKESFNNFIYSLLLSIIFLLISITIYILYSYIPFFNTTNTDDMNKTTPDLLNLFIDPIINNKGNEDITNIYTNQNFNTNIKGTFVIIAVVIFIISILFLKYCPDLKNKVTENSFIKNIFKGFLGSSAILILPILWVMNFIISIQYFYIYPIFLIIVRFFRYILMSIIYNIYKDKSGISSNLYKKFDNFKNYSPSWGLIGVEELKLIMGLFGFENIFSDDILQGTTNSVDISNNKFVSSGLLGFFTQGNKKGMFYSILYFIISLIISLTIIFGVLKIQNTEYNK